jgi:hypothetical protein
LALRGNDLYAGGAFTGAGGRSTNWIAKWDGNVWSALGSGVNNPVYALAVSGDALYAGGDFTSAGSHISGFVAKALLVSPANPLPNPFLADGAFVSYFDGTPGFAYTIEYTDSLELHNWHKATNLTAPPTDQGFGVGVFEFRDGSATVPTRFYRSVYPSY